MIHIYIQKNGQGWKRVETYMGERAARSDPRRFSIYNISRTIVAPGHTHAATAMRRPPNV